MGCICSKGTSSNQFVAESRVKDKDLGANRSLRHSGPSRGERASIEADGSGNDATAKLISDPSRDGHAGSTPNSSDEEEKNLEITGVPSKPQVEMNSNMGIGVGGQGQPRLSRIYKGERGAQVLAGWPSWLTAVAGEAISGWIPRRADSFEKLEKIGQGTYSSVYRARDLESNKIVALKKVRFANMDPESVRFMAREIIILRRLNHLNVMKLEGMITSRVSGSVYLIFEYMDHDLSGLAAISDRKFTEAQIKCYMQQLLRGLEHCHSHGVLHRDIKGSNLLVSNNGNLKIGDFGLATFFQSSQSQIQPLTSRVVTLWYRPPELLLGATDYGVAVDLWSSGCILAELFAGKPIMPGRTEVEQLHKIFKLCGSPSEEYWRKSKLPHATIFKPHHPYERVVAETFNDFPSSALSLLESLLAVEPEDRETASLALQSEFFTTEPLPCDPSTLPKYPPSKEFDAKLREDEARRRRAAGGKGHDQELDRRSTRESKAVPAPDANAELQASIEKRILQPNSVSEKFNTEDDGGTGFPIEPARSRPLNIFSHSGQSMHPTSYGSLLNMADEEALADPGHILSSRNTAELRKQGSFSHVGAGPATKISRFSNSVAVRGGGLRFDIGGAYSGSSNLLEDRFRTRYSHLTDESNHLLDRSSYKEFHPAVKEPSMGSLPKNGRIHYSGPLVPSGGNLEEILEEHERQIQHAVRKARIENFKTNETGRENSQTESLLHHRRNNS